jgi:ABC-type nitrate/sulfonate/bicarbonate transport system substrate-binding protein
VPITLQGSLRGLFYAPYYAALALGAYRREGMAIGFASASGPVQAPAALFDGTVGNSLAEEVFREDPPGL